MAPNLAERPVTVLPFGDVLQGTPGLGSIAGPASGSAEAALEQLWPQNEFGHLLGLAAGAQKPAFGASGVALAAQRAEAMAAAQEADAQARRAVALAAAREAEASRAQAQLAELEQQSQSAQGGQELVQRWGTAAEDYAAREATSQVREATAARLAAEAALGQAWAELREEAARHGDSEAQLRAGAATQVQEAQAQAVAEVQWARQQVQAAQAAVRAARAGGLQGRIAQPKPAGFRVVAQGQQLVPQPTGPRGQQMVLQPTGPQGTAWGQDAGGSSQAAAAWGQQPAASSEAGTSTNTENFEDAPVIRRQPGLQMPSGTVATDDLVAVGPLQVPSVAAEPMDSVGLPMAPVAMGSPIAVGQPVSPVLLPGMAGASPSFGQQTMPLQAVAEEAAPEAR